MFGATRVARIAITTITTRISMRVKPEVGRRLGDGGGAHSRDGRIGSGKRRRPAMVGWTPHDRKWFSGRELGTVEASNVKEALPFRYGYPLTEDSAQTSYPGFTSRVRRC